MPNFSSNWKIIWSENFKDFLKVLGMNMMLRKIPVVAATNCLIEIKQEGDTFYIKTFTTRSSGDLACEKQINFKIEEEFEEPTVDRRSYKALVMRENENKLVCEQRLHKAEGLRASWIKELTFGSSA
ncbi:PREDICTED: cellular retinoic acid-binding protein 2-like [Elephantulus edwardii]|uniref:cellular retinoic acid-binding protein 2-like n=1 Tax=Elephantulus edwardii TaxID=28737 RepID=UPI0003F07F82|nr:PREDICTED: cellular retinoic acid-binding protein 2-like [Elephantulus edwardii]